MKLFSFAAVLTGLVLVTLSVRRRKDHPPAVGLADSDTRYAIDDLLNGLDQD